jgi:HAD superfamily hydrolase (TIGR01549 family)
VTRTYRVVLFDLFGTVAHFVPPANPPRGAFEWLRGPFAEHQPTRDFRAFCEALVEVSTALAAERALDHRERPSRERFRRALVRLDPAASAVDARVLDVAEALSLAHMAHLASLTDVPPAHVDLLRDLARRYRLGVVSNFDHAPTAVAILARHDLQRCFDVVLISDEFGRRKPHPSIFQAALDHLGAAADEALFVGDTPADDIAGAQAAGIDVAWVNRHGAEPCDPAPTYELRDLTDLRTFL